MRAARRSLVFPAVFPFQQLVAHARLNGVLRGIDVDSGPLVVCIAAEVQLGELVTNLFRAVLERSERVELQSDFITVNSIGAVNDRRNWVSKMVWKAARLAVASSLAGQCFAWSLLTFHVMMLSAKGWRATVAGG